ncbi:1-aminocyclopropane-1-carboxylate deaminase/D-cysteine desulfhydrase [Pontibacter sp. JAM-7]|uniref:1-aminocyclopropane-1-carboxylate deaminase/D-cysteine desulfhydrase n=1 Tax=Pontibacter sp. JAM-7 TaxID=3366581 RepID=UPI003AF52E40
MTVSDKQSAWLHRIPVPRVQPLQLTLFAQNQVKVSLLRLDQIDEGLSGNKWFKLKYNLQHAVQHGYRQLLSFGGAYSNHIHALAWAGARLGVPTVGIIRGEPVYATNPTLTDAQRWGMQLQFVDRKTYRLRYQQDYLDQLQERYPDSWIVPEGGSNALALKGCSEILSADLLHAVQPDCVILPCGTGGTLAGLVQSWPELNILGVPVLKQAAFLQQDIQQLLDQVGCHNANRWQLDLHGAFGGYAKTCPELETFMAQFYRLTGIELDVVYTGKMLLRLCQLIETGYFSPGSSILALHTGGLQGNRG